MRMGGLSKTDSKVVGSKKRNQYGFFFVQIFKFSLKKQSLKEDYIMNEKRTFNRKAVEKLVASKDRKSLQKYDLRGADLSKMYFREAKLDGSFLSQCP